MSASILKCCAYIHTPNSRVSYQVWFNHCHFFHCSNPLQHLTVMWPNEEIGDKAVTTTDYIKYYLRKSKLGVWMIYAIRLYREIEASKVSHIQDAHDKHKPNKWGYEGAPPCIMVYKQCMLPWQWPCIIIATITHYHGNHRIIMGSYKGRHGYHLAYHDSHQQYHGYHHPLP